MIDRIEAEDHVYIRQGGEIIWLKPSQKVRQESDTFLFIVCVVAAAAIAYAICIFWPVQ